MSRENVEVVTGFLDAFTRGDVDAAIAPLDPDVEFDWASSRGVHAGRFRGRAEVAKWLRDFRDTWDEFSFEPESFTELGDDYVLVVDRVRGRGRAGVEVVAHEAQLWLFEHGRAMRVTRYDSEDAARSAIEPGPTPTP
jgi:ketosteroid isomerase-like protein